MQNVTVTSAKDTARIKRQLAVERRCIAVGTPIFGSTMNSLRFHDSGILTMRLGPSDPVVGGHAWCVCGYADNSWLTNHNICEMPGGGAYLIRNSWGDWAARNPVAHHIGAGPGYALMPYAYMANYGWESLAVSLQAVAQKLPAHNVRVSRASTWWQRATATVAADSAARLQHLMETQTHRQRSPTMNLEHTLIATLSLPAFAIEKLGRLGLKTAHELILLAYLEEQRTPLAQHLGLPRADLDTVLDQLLQNIPTEGLNRLAAQAREIRNIPSGLIPPDTEQQAEAHGNDTS
jgi:hypothetical protein